MLRPIPCSRRLRLQPLLAALLLLNLFVRWPSSGVEMVDVDTAVSLATMPLLATRSPPPAMWPPLSSNASAAAGGGAGSQQLRGWRSKRKQYGGRGGRRQQAEQPQPPSLPKNAPPQEEPEQQFPNSSLTCPDARALPRGYAAVCAAIRGGHEDVREWVEYHLWLGLDVYLWDDHSTPPIASVLDDLVLRSGGRVMVVRVPDPTARKYWYPSHTALGGRKRDRRPWSSSAQSWAYDHCLQPAVRARHRWIALIDGDEYLVMRQPNDTARGSAVVVRPPDLVGYLKTLEHCGGVELNWVVFSSAGHRTRPPGGVLANYKRCLPRSAKKSRGFKMLVNTAWGLRGKIRELRSHTVVMLPRALTCKSDGSVVDPGRHGDHHSTNATHWPLVLHHYISKSAEQAAAKLLLGAGDNGPKKDAGYMARIEAEATEDCEAAQRYVPACCPSLQRGLR